MRTHRRCKLTTSVTPTTFSGPTTTSQVVSGVQNVSATLLDQAERGPARPRCTVASSVTLSAIILGTPDHLTGGSRGPECEHGVSFDQAERVGGVDSIEAERTAAWDRDRLVVSVRRATTRRGGIAFCGLVR